MGILQIASTFTATPLKAALQAAFERQGIPQEVGFSQYSQMAEFMLRPAQFADGVMGALVLLRVEDWLRDDLKSAPPNPGLDNQARQQLVSRTEDFITQLSVLTDAIPQVWVMVCPSNGWIATRHNLRTLCRTYSNIVTAKVRKLPVTLVNCPPFLLTAESEDQSTDRLGQMPFTQSAYDQLGEYLADEIKRTFRQTEMSVGIASADSTQFATYLAGLNVQVKLHRPEGAERKHVERMLRTIASFSLTGERPFLKDDEIEQMLGRGECFLVSVSDRLADYGPTGFVHFHELDSDMVVEGMSLSCVVLGKQAEFAVLSALAEYARGRDLKKMIFRFIAADRNQPMQVFLESIATNDPEVGYVANVSEFATRIGQSAIKPGAWTVAFPSSSRESTALT
jgi:hypothetical protein